MRNRVSVLCLATGVALLAAKLAAVVADPASASTGVFLQLLVGVVAFSLLVFGWRVRRAGGEGPNRRWRLLLLSVIGWGMTGFILMIAWVDHGLAQRTYAGVYNEAHKVWATRGLVTDGSDGSPIRDRNTIESVRHAFDRGAKGTEIDVFYDSELGVFVVAHSSHYRPGRVLLTLEAMFEAVGDDGYFWLDWKDQRLLHDDQLRAALARLERLTDRGDMRERVYVEGEAPLSLRVVQQAGFRTILDSRPMRDKNLLDPVLVDVYKAIYYFGGFTVMGLNSGTRAEPIYGPTTRRGLRNIPMFVYHVPDDLEFLEELASSRDVRVIIIEQKVDRFGFVAGDTTH